MVFTKDEKTFEKKNKYGSTIYATCEIQTKKNKKADETVRHFQNVVIRASQVIREEKKPEVRDLGDYLANL